MLLQAALAEQVLHVRHKHVLAAYQCTSQRCMLPNAALRGARLPHACAHLFSDGLRTERQQAWHDRARCFASDFTQTCISTLHNLPGVARPWLAESVVVLSKFPFCACVHPCQPSVYLCSLREAVPSDTRVLDLTCKKHAGACGCPLDGQHTYCTVNHQSEYNTILHCRCGLVVEHA